MTRKLFVSLVLLGLAAPACGTAPATEDPGSPESLEQRAGYALGYSAGQTLSAQGADIDVEQLVSGLRDSLGGADSKMTPEEMQSTMTEFQQAMAAAETTRREEEGAANRAAGEAFLADNADNPGVVVLDSGLQYQILTETGGPKPVRTDEITAHYEGRLIDGTVFDSSIANGVPMTIELGRLVPGFIEGVELMSVGSKYRLFIPGELGYGPQGAGAMIGPNQTLIFEVELLAINGQS